MYQQAIDRRFTSVREVLDYIDTHFSIMNLDNTTLDLLEPLFKTLNIDTKKEILETIIRSRFRETLPKQLTVRSRL